MVSVVLGGVTTGGGVEGGGRVLLAVYLQVLFSLT